MLGRVFSSLENEGIELHGSFYLEREVPRPKLLWQAESGSAAGDGTRPVKTPFLRKEKKMRKTTIFIWLALMILVPPVYSQRGGAGVGGATDPVPRPASEYPPLTYETIVEVEILLDMLLRLHSAGEPGK